MSKGAAFLLVLTMLFCLGNSVLAGITQIDVIQYDGKSTFDADAGTWGMGQLSTNFNNGALLKTDANPFGTFYYGTASLSSSLQTDLCVGGVLKGYYEGNTWSIQLYTDSAHTNKVLDVSGNIMWYDELELIPDSVDGRAICTITSMMIDDMEFPDTEWGGDGITCGYRTTSTSFVDNLIDANPITLENYDLDFAAQIVTLTVYADPTGIPEPATLSLLAVGGLALLRKRRS